MWEIYAYQNADSLFGVFNAAAAIHGADDYRAALAAVAFCGFVAALVAYAFAPEKLQGWKWLATVLLVFGVLIVPRVTVGIVDKTGGSAVKVVDNVPFGMALLGSLTSNIGHTLTGLFETTFQVIPGAGALPAELTYEKNGLMFGNRLIRDTSGVVFQDPGFRTDLINFIHNCTTYDLIDGTLDPAGFAGSDDVWALMATPNPARFTTLTGGGGVVTIATCTDARANLDGRLPAQVTRIQGRLAFQLNPTLPAAAAGEAIAGQIQQAYIRNGIADAAKTAADLIRQNAVLNAIQDTGKIVGQKVNDPAAMVLAVGRAQSVAQQNAAWLNQGKVAEQALPVLRNVIEAVTYALFPLLVLMLLLTSGRETMLAFKGYASVLIWIQLWPPLYAVLNYMASIYAAHDLAAAADLGTGVKALSLQTASTIYARAISGEAVVGYMVISIPVIAWAAVKRMEHLGTALAGGMAGLQGTVAGATASAASGNVSLGNVAMDQMRLSPNRSSAFMSSWQDDRSGNTFSASALSGRTAVSLLRNQGYAARVVSVRVSEQDVQEASRQVEAARSESVAAHQERSAVLTEAFSKGLSKVKSASSSSGTSSSSYEQLGQTLNQLDQITRSVAETTGMTQSQVANIAFGAAAHLGGKLGPLGGQLDARAQKSYVSGLSAVEQKVLGSMTTDQISAFKQFGDRASQDRTYATSIGSDAREAKELASRLSESAARSARSDASLADRVAVADRISTARERGETLSIDIAQDPYNQDMMQRFAERYGGSSTAARTMLDAELARQSLAPNHLSLDRQALPTTFRDIERMHQTQQIKVDDHAAGLDRTNRSTAASRLAGYQPEPQSHRPKGAGTPDLRSDLQTETSELRDRATQRELDFDARAQVKTAKGGTLATERSLIKGAVSQVVGDAEATGRAALDAVENMLKPKR